jgi:hypothetical protein
VSEIQYIVGSLAIGHNKMKKLQKILEDLQAEEVNDCVEVLLAPLIQRNLQMPKNPLENLKYEY